MSTINLNIKQIWIFYLLYFLVLPLSFFIRTFYSKVLTLEEFGYIYSIISFLGFFSLFINLGLSSSLKYFIPKFNVKNDYKSIKNLFWYTFLIHFTLVCIILSILYISSGLISILFFHTLEIKPYFNIFLIYFMFTNLLASLYDVFVSFQLNVHYQLIRFFQFFFLLSVSVFIYFIGFVDLGLKFAFLYGLSNILVFVIYLIFIFKKFPYLIKKPNFDKDLLKKHFSYSFYIFISSLGFVIFSNVDSLIITYFLGTNQTGIYLNVVAIVNIIVSLFTSINVILMPLFSKKNEEKDYIYLSNILSLLYNLVLYLIIPFCLVFVFFSEFFLRFLFGNDFVVGSSVLILFSLFVIFKLIYSYNISFMNGLGMAKNISKIVLIIAFLNLFLNIILINTWGLIGVASSTVFSWVLLSIFTFKAIFEKLKFKLDIKKTLKIIICTIIYILSLFYIKKISFFVNFYLNSVFVLSCAFIIYFIMGYFFKIYTIKELYVFIPESKLKQNIIKFHSKYLYYLK